jgi:archaellum component FlaC
MTDYSDILDKLREFNYFRKDLNVCHDAADAIEALVKRIEYLDNVLGSFGDRLMSKQEQVKYLLKKCDRLEKDMKKLAKAARDSYRFIDE